MKKFITACLIVLAFIAFTTKPTLAEPITLTVMAITGLIAVASSAGVDAAHHAVVDSHKEKDSAVVIKNDDRAQAQNDSTIPPAGQQQKQLVVCEDVEGVRCLLESRIPSPVRGGKNAD